MSMPGALATHEALFECPLLQISDEITICPAALVHSAPTAAGAAGRLVYRAKAVSRRRVVGGTGLQSDRLGWIEMARYPLDGRGNAALLLLHGRRPLPRSSCSLLLVQIW